MKKQLSNIRLSKPKNRSLKFGYLAVAALMLQACQGVGMQTDSLQGQSLQTLPFADNLSTPSAQAKQSLIKAMNQHLLSERYSLSTYRYRVVPHLAKDSIDAGSDSLWMTALKTYEYKTTADSASYQSDAYRTTEDYLNEEGSLPYLRYDDEKKGAIPDHVITRETAMDAQYLTADSDIMAAYMDQYRCLTDAADTLDQIVLTNPTLTVKDRKIKDQLKVIDGCITQANQDFDAQKSKAQGYQIDDIANIRQCATSYQRDLNQVLSASRKHPSLTGEAYDGYLMAYNQFLVCDQDVWYGMIYMDPLGYIDRGLTAKQLDVRSLIRECSQTQLTANKNLRRQGKTLANSPESFLQTHFDGSYCIAMSLDEPIEDVQRPTSLEEADELDTQVFFKLLMGEADSDEPKPVLRQWFEAYKSMKLSEQTKPTNTGADSDAMEPLPLPLPEDMGGIYTNMMSSMLDYMKKTPEQLDAKNFYQYENTAFTILSHYAPAQRKINSVMALDYESPTAKQSIQAPILIDFDQGSITVDASAALPVSALALPKYAPLPKDTKDGMVKFYLPKPLEGVIPTNVIYEAMVNGYLAGFGELDVERFTPVVMTSNPYARNLGATQAIKLSLSKQEVGKHIGVILKYIAKDLKAYVDAHPERYSEDSDNPINAVKIKQIIDDWVLINQGHHTDDIGSALALLESIMPMSSSDHIYYYLNSRGQLIGLQYIQSINQHMQNTRTQTIAQTRFSSQPIAHPYASKLIDGTKDSSDGNAWVHNIRQDIKLGELARQARDDYDTVIDDSDAALILDDSDAALTDK